MTEVVPRCCLSLSQLTYLPPPWGDCKATPMDSDFFSTYSITACRIDCETRYLVENCNCRMVHMPGRNQKGIPDCRIQIYLHLFLKMSVLPRLLLWLQVLSFEIVVTKTVLEEQTSNCSKSDTFTVQWIGKLKLFSLCVCAVITTGICCLPPTFNHCVASQTANWKGVWHRGNIWIWPPLTCTHLSNNC